jgi:hypothetical protein
VRKTSKGTSLKRWQKEKWTDTKTGKACGAGGSNEYCRPKKKVSSKTPKTIGEISKSTLASKKAEKSRVGMGSRVTSLSALDELFELDRMARGKQVKMLGKKSMIREGSLAARMHGGGAYAPPLISKKDKESLAKFGAKSGEVHVSHRPNRHIDDYRLRRDILGHELGHRKNARSLQRKMGPRAYAKFAKGSTLGFLAGSQLGGLGSGIAAGYGDRKKSAAVATAATAGMAPRLIDEAVATARIANRNKKRGLKTSKRFLAMNIGSYGLAGASPWLIRSLTHKLRDRKKKK